MAKRMATTIRREQIAEAALALVAEQGLSALTARNVAQAIGVTAPALYRHFPGGKAAILASVLDLLDSVRAHDFGPGLQTSDSALSKLYRYYRAHIKTIARFRALPHLMLADSLWDEVPQLRDRLQASHQEQHKRVAAIIAAGQAQGEIRSDLGADQIFVEFLAQFLTIAILYSRPNSSIDLEEQAKGNWKMFVRAVSP